MLQGLGIKSGVDLDKLLVASAFIDKALSNRYLLPRTYSLTHLLTYSLTHLLTYLLTYSLTHSLVHSLIYS